MLEKAHNIIRDYLEYFDLICIIEKNIEVKKQLVE